MSTHLDQVIEDLRAFVRERDWQQFHDVKNLAMLLASEAGELLTELRWVRSDEVEHAVSDPIFRDRVIDELGDLAISLFLLCDKLRVDVVDVAAAKLRKNAERYPTSAARGVPTRPN